MDKTKLYETKVKLGGQDIEDIKEILKDEDQFQPRCHKDRLIIAIVKQIAEGEFTEIDG